MEKKYISTLASITGIAVNALLCTIKLRSGFATNSIAIISDGFNNLTDIGNAVLVFIGYRIALKPADKEHPYGHGRVEYMLSQGISIMIMTVGLSLLKSSIERLITPSAVKQDTRVIILLIISLLAKLALAGYYHQLYKKSGILPLKAQMTDSLSDSVSTAVIIIGYYLTPLTVPYLDAIIGLLVSLLIIKSGFDIFREMSSLLLGNPESEETLKKVTDICLSFAQVKGIHDLRIHTYGPDITYGSADIDLDYTLTLARAHDILDAIEEKVFEETGIKMTLHADPVEESDSLISLKNRLMEILGEYDTAISFHDLHYNKELDKYSVDLLIPYENKLNEEELKERILESFHEITQNSQCEIRIDHN